MRKVDSVWWSSPSVQANIDQVNISINYNTVKQAYFPPLATRLVMWSLHHAQSGE